MFSKIKQSQIKFDYTRGYFEGNDHFENKDLI